MISQQHTFPQSVSGAVPVLLLYSAIYSVLALWIEPTSVQSAAADPLIHMLEPLGGLWAVPVLCVAATLPWAIAVRPQRADIRAALLYAAVGIAAATVAVGGVRAAFGPHLPAFIPREESSAPGLVLGLGAGILEEAIFRFGILSLAYIALQRSMRPIAAAILASALTGLLFAASHELGPGAQSPFDFAIFATRALVPGMIMSLAYLRVHPAFLVSAHAAAHFWLAWLFVAPVGIT